MNSVRRRSIFCFDEMMSYMTWFGLPQTMSGRRWHAVCTIATIDPAHGIRRPDDVGRLESELVATNIHDLFCRYIVALAAFTNENS